MPTQTLAVRAALRMLESRKTVRPQYVGDFLIQYSRANPQFNLHWHDGVGEYKEAYAAAKKTLRVMIPHTENENGQKPGMFEHLNGSRLCGEPGELRWCRGRRRVARKEPPVTGMEHPDIVGLMTLATEAAKANGKGDFDDLIDNAIPRIARYKVVDRTREVETYTRTLRAYLMTASDLIDANARIAETEARIEMIETRHRAEVERLTNALRLEFNQQVDDKINNLRNELGRPQIENKNKTNGKANGKANVGLKEHMDA